VSSETSPFAGASWLRTAAISFEASEEMAALASAMSSQSRDPAGASAASAGTTSAAIIAMDATMPQIERSIGAVNMV
jgi:hypothetical protein